MDFAAIAALTPNLRGVFLYPEDIHEITEMRNEALRAFEGGDTETFNYYVTEGIPEAYEDIRRANKRAHDIFEQGRRLRENLRAAR